MVEQGGTVKKMGFNQWLVKKCVWNSAKDTPYFRASLVWRNTHVDMGRILSQRLEILNAPWFHMCEAKRAYMLHQTCQCFKPHKIFSFPCGLPLVILWRTQNMSGWWFQTWMDYFLLLSMGFSFHNWLVVSIMFIFHFIYGIILPIDFHSIIFQDGYCTTITMENHHVQWVNPLFLW